jgi:hypothetical protein
MVLVLSSLTLLSFALARVPLGEPVSAQTRQNLEGAYFIAFYTRTCLEPQDIARHWAALRASNTGVLAVNPVESDNTALGPPTGFEQNRLRVLNGPQALALSRSLKVRSYPTTVLVDAENRIRDALEGALTPERVQRSLNLLTQHP